MVIPVTTPRIGFTRIGVAGCDQAPKAATRESTPVLSFTVLSVPAITNYKGYSSLGDRNLKLKRPI